MRWHGSVAVITGASRGIGRAVAIEAAKRGATLGLIARTETDLRAVLAECGGKGAIAAADVSDRAAVEGALAALAADVGPADILVNNAGAGAYGSFLDTSVEDYERMIRVNYYSTLYAMKAAVPSMVARGRGHVVNVCSIAGRIGAPFESAYSGSKFAVAGMSEAAAIELGPKGVGVSLVDPGPVKTSFFEARGVPYSRKSPRPVTAEKVAARVMAAVESNKLEVFVPRWLGAAVVARFGMPAMYRIGTTRSYKDQL